VFGALPAGWTRGDEELRVANTGDAEMTMLAFLAPKFGTS
jgi:hypothetical protein